MIIDGITTTDGTQLDVSELNKIDDTNPKGKVLQVIHKQCGTSITFTGAGFQDIDMSEIITPKSATSKMLIEWKVHIYNDTATTSDWEAINVRLLEGSNVLWTDKTHNSLGGHQGWDMTSAVFKYYHSHGVLTPITYTIQADQESDTRTILLNQYGEGFITIMEIEQ